MKGIKGFADEINLDRIRFKNRLDFPDKSYIGTWMMQVVDVGKNGGMFSTISEAIREIQGLVSSSRQFVLRIGGEIFEEQITLPGWIHIFSVGISIIVCPPSQTAITIKGDTRIQGVSILPLTGAAPAITCTGNLSAFGLSASRGITLSGDCAVRLAYSEVGKISHSGAGDFSLRAPNSKISGGISKSGTGLADIRLVSSEVNGQLLSSEAEYQLALYNSQILDPDGRPLLFLDPVIADSYVRMQSCILSSDTAVDSISRNGTAGTVEVWTLQNGLSSGYGPNVNEHIPAGNNVISAEIANFRLS